MIVFAFFKRIYRRKREIAESKGEVMIEIPQSSIALNSHDVPGTKYDMWATWNVPANTDAKTIIMRVLSLSVCADDDLKCLVINCHGKYGKGTNNFGNQKLISTGGFGLSIGTGINLDNVNLFSHLRGSVKCIIIVACGAAWVTNPGTKGDGARFCSEIAINSGAYVIAPQTLQIETKRALPKNHIDNFEGVIYRFNPSGSLDDSGLLGRKLIHDIF